MTWRSVVRRPVSVSVLCRALPILEQSQIATWLNAGQGAPVFRAAMVLETVLMEAPQAEVPALILAEAFLAQSLGWKHLVPLLAPGQKRADLRRQGDDLRLACHRALIASAVESASITASLTRRTEHVKAVAPKLRAKGAGKAGEIFLTCDAVAAAALPLPPRAARRLCDRLVELGTVRELTGRDTFRLYGV
ncbi:hypothetical protein DSM14862_03555 (plasmid) [Sulfitobacter indolifex]|uniref:DUF1403 family protein n=1 Tax=Sulfitobacter indolifex HEL-45 TaxID=391624 RepID=A0ABM9X110_9RHOB|nr:hypothetical protein OIHEL45_19491 [Sulfitobacter indolifex HEL-45]UOA20717.1 hypothetical protein DSM14862_03555 [Sulfitobacter indolifex]